MPDKKFIEVRCSGDRKHYAAGIEYDTCGSMFFGINKDDPKCDLILKCKVCKRSWHIVSDGQGNITKEIVDGKIEFERGD